MTHDELVTEFGKTWNHRDTSFIEKYLAADFNYTSQWVFDEIRGKEEYLKYFKGKLEAINISESKVEAEIGVYHKKECLVITQRNDNEDMRITFLISTKEGQITSAATCAVPAPESIELLGIKPV